MGCSGCVSRSLMLFGKVDVGCDLGCLECVGIWFYSCVIEETVHAGYLFGCNDGYICCTISYMLG